MLESILGATTGSVTFNEILLCTAASLVLGAIIAGLYRFRNPCNRNFLLALALLPVLVQAVILVVNGNLGAGVAVMGAFGLIRFRSVPGSAREITAIFFSMAVGLATGMGYVAYAGLFTLIVGVALVVYGTLAGAPDDTTEKSLRVTIPEDLDYTSLFDDLFGQYTRRATLERVKTTNLGSLYELQYTITMKAGTGEKAFLDEIRKRNGNLNIILSRKIIDREAL